MNNDLDSILERMRTQDPDPADVAQAAAHVRAILFPHAEGHAAAVAVPARTIKSCADFISLIPAYLAGTLDTGRRMLLEAHTRECVGCRRALAEARTGAKQPIEFTPPRAAKRPSYTGWAVAASVTFGAGIAGWYGWSQFPALAGGPRATVASVDGGLFKVSGNTLAPLGAGAGLGENDAVRTAKNSTAVLRLNDGSRIEMNQRAQVSVTRNWSGSTVHLSLGSIIVEAAKQHRGTLQVATSDCNVSVKGTVFSVDAGTKGSRVAVVEGTVWVDHGRNHDVLHKGDIASTAPGMEPVAIRSEFEWSRNSSQYMSLLDAITDVKRDIDRIPAPGLRHETKLMAYLPADIAAVAAIPNIGDTLKQAGAIFHDHLKQSGALNAWWMGIPANQRDGFEKTIGQLETASQYLGNEIVIAAGTSPIVLAQMAKPGLEAYLRAQLPPDAVTGHMRFDDNLFVAAPNPADMKRIAPAGDFLRTALYRQLAPAYRQGAGWLMGADLSLLPNAPDLAGARYLVGQSRTYENQTENRASVIFARDREGIASWLAAPGPMGSLEFVSPDAGFAFAAILKNPALIVKDLTGMMKQSMLDANLTNEIAGSLGGEITVALDGPLFPVPSWKVAAEIYYPERFEAAVEKFAASNTHAALTEEQIDGRTYYRLKYDNLPWGAEWTFYDGYWLAAANRELIVRAIQNRETGYTLAKSKQFRGQLPHDASTDFSAVLYHSLGQTLAPLNALLGSTTANVPRFEDTPGALCFWAAPDRIDVATMGSILNLKLESLLSMKDPLQMVGQAVSPVRRPAP